MKDGYVTTQPQLARIAAKSPYGGITGRPRTLKGYLELPDGRMFYLGDIGVKLDGQGDGGITEVELHINAPEFENESAEAAPEASTDIKEKRKCAVVLFSVGEEAKMQFNTSSAWYFGPLKIFSSTLRAKDFCEKKARELIGRDSSLVLHWENEATLRLLKKNGESYDEVDSCFEIYETEIDDNVPANFHYPPIEEENEALRNECWILRRRMAAVMARNAVAASYATMWDGGYNYTKERVLEVLHKVKDVLAEDHDISRELFEAWKKEEEKENTQVKEIGV